MPYRCALCGTDNATCGQRTAHRTIAVDEPVKGLKVVGNKLMPDLTAVQNTLTDMSDDEREEFTALATAMHGRSLRNQLRERQQMANGSGSGNMAHTFLDRVYCTDGIIRKMKPAEAEEYVKTYGDQGAVIVAKGGMPMPRTNEIIGASKATIGEVFKPDGTQIPDAQLLTSRTFHATDSVRREAMAPTPGTAVGSMDTTLTQHQENEAGSVASDGTRSDNATPVTTPRARRNVATGADEPKTDE